MELLLQALNAVSPMSEGLVWHLRSILKEQSIAKGKFLLTAGQVSRDICFISEGLLRCFHEKNGKETSRWFMKEGDFICSISSFYDQVPSSEFIQAIESTQTFYITYQELQGIYSLFPEFERICRLLTEKYYQLWDQQLYAVLNQSALERYSWLLQYHPELVLRVPAKYLASYLGINEFTLSKIKMEKRQSGQRSVHL